MSSHTLFQQFTYLEAAKAQIVTCEEVIEKEDENRYQRTAGFLPVDGEVALENVDAVKTLEVADINPFASLYQMDEDTMIQTRDTNQMLM